MKHNNVFAIVMAVVFTLLLILQGVEFLHMMGFSLSYRGQSFSVGESSAWDFVESINATVFWIAKIVSPIFIGVVIHNARRDRSNSRASRSRTRATSLEQDQRVQNQSWAQLNSVYTPGTTKRLRVQKPCGAFSLKIKFTLEKSVSKSISKLSFIISK